MRKILLGIISLLSYPWRLLPFSFRKKFFFLFFVLESRGKSPENSLRRMFALEDSLSLVINERALSLGNGEHPKHKLTSYHNFFIDNLCHEANILDVGCGYGAVARSVARALPQSRVIGIDNDTIRLNQALLSQNPSNLEFKLINLEDYKPDYKIDAVILSNVLEHLNDRVESLIHIKKVSNAPKFLIRVPLFERHWTIAMRETLGVNYFQDSDHKIEHRIQEFEREMNLAGLTITKKLTLWGEIWAVCECS
jgi:2-polyprenyl-3-methyl-5-hydroxy-6-metoxy-1,4-benzoquinol methylase